MYFIGVGAVVLTAEQLANGISHMGDTLLHRVQGSADDIHRRLICRVVG